MLNASAVDAVHYYRPGLHLGFVFELVLHDLTLPGAAAAVVLDAVVAAALEFQGTAGQAAAAAAVGLDVALDVLGTDVQGVAVAALGTAEQLTDLHALDIQGSDAALRVAVVVDVDALDAVGQVAVAGLDFQGTDVEQIAVVVALAAGLNEDILEPAVVA